MLQSQPTELPLIHTFRVVAESSKLSQVGCADEQWFKRIPLALFKLELSRTSTGSVQSWPKGYFLVAFEISAAELPSCRRSAKSPIDAAYQIGSL